MKKSKHDNIVKTLEDRLETEGFTNIESLVHFKRKKVEGECDLFATKNNKKFYFEIKTTDSRKAYKCACHQLWKDNKYLGHGDYFFYVYGHKSNRNHYCEQVII